MTVPLKVPIINTVMSVLAQYEVLKCLVRVYFSDELQHNETPAAAKKRQEILKEILEIAEGKNI